MRDIEVVLADVPGALGEFGRVLGEAGVSLEGGGVFGDVAHFLVADAARAREALRAAGIGPVTVHDVLTTRLDQGTPGSLGRLARDLGAAGVNIWTQYSDHDGRLILVVDPAHRDAAEMVLDQSNSSMYSSAGPSSGRSRSSTVPPSRSSSSTVTTLSPERSSGAGQ